MNGNVLIRTACALLGLTTVLGAARPAQSADYVTPQTYDATCGTAGHDCTSGFNSMLAAAVGGVKAYVPCGTYDTNSGFYVGGAFNGLTVEGAGYCATLRGTAQVNLLTIGDGVHGTGQVKISNLHLSYTSSAPDAALYLPLTYETTLKNLWMDGNIYNGIEADGFGLLSAYNVHVNSCSNDGIIVRGAGGLNAEFYMDPASIVAGCAQNGVHVAGDAGGVRIDGASIANNIGLLVDGSANREIFLGTDSDMGSNQWINVLVQPYAISSSGYFMCVGCWADAAQTGYGVYINQQGGLHGQFTGAKLNSNASYPFVWLDSGSVTVSGSVVDLNGAGMYFGAGSHVCSANIGGQAC